jgi:hypothetical protein
MGDGMPLPIFPAMPYVVPRCGCDANCMRTLTPCCCRQHVKSRTAQFANAPVGGLTPAFLQTITAHRKSGDGVCKPGPGSWRQRASGPQTMHNA